MHRLALVAMLALAGVITGHTSAPGNDWAINATAIEACSCPHFCICYFNFSIHPAAHHDHGQAEHYCKFNNAYREVNHGHYGDPPPLKAQKVLDHEGDLGGDFSQGQMNWALVTFDKATSADQRKALENSWPRFPGQVEIEIFSDRRRQY